MVHGVEDVLDLLRRVALGLEDVLELLERDVALAARVDGGTLFSGFSHCQPPFYAR